MLAYLGILTGGGRSKGGEGMGGEKAEDVDESAKIGTVL